MYCIDWEIFSYYSGLLNTVEATYKGLLYKGTAAYEGSLQFEKYSYLFLCTNFCPL